MAWHAGTTTTGPNHYRDLLSRLVAAATSKHVSALPINNGGTGYTDGDVLTISHASEPTVTPNTMPCRFEVTAAGGVVTGIRRILSAGSFSLRVASATVAAGGSGYVVGDVIEVQGGTATEKAKFRVATLSGSAVATVTLFESGGAYSAAPSSPASTVGVGPSTFAGNNACTLTLTTQAEIGVIGIAATGGTGTDATFNLTLTASGWAAQRNRNNFSVNSINDEKEVVLLGTVAGGDAPLVGMRTYTQDVTPNIRYGWVTFAMDFYNDSVSIESQSNVGPATTVGTTGVNLLMFNASEAWWFSVTGRRLLGVRKAQGGALLTYQSFYLGLMNPFGTTAESPYPMYLSGSSSVSNRAPDAASNLVTGLTELFSESSTACPAFFRHPGTGAYTRVQNASAGGALRANVLYPLGNPNRAGTAGEDFISTEGTYQFYVGIGQHSGAAATVLLFPTLVGFETLLVPCTVISAPTTADADPDATPRGELDQVFWISATKSDGGVMTPEDTVTIGTQRYRVFPNAGRAERYSFFVLKEL